MMQRNHIIIINQLIIPITIINHMTMIDHCLCWGPWSSCTTAELNGPRPVDSTTGGGRHSPPKIRSLMMVQLVIN